MNSNNPKNTDAALNALSQKLGCSKEELNSAIKSGQLNSVLERLDKGNAQKINSVLQNPNAAKKLLESDAAKALMEKLFG